MRLAALLAFVLALGGLSAAVALADGLPIPTVPTVTVPKVSVPSVTLPTPAPPAPPSPLPALAPAPSASTPSVQTSAIGSGDASGGSQPGSSSSAGSSSGSGAGSSAGTSAGSTGSSAPRSGSAVPRLIRLKSSRPYISRRDAKRRSTTLDFELGAQATVIFTFVRVSPDCRLAGRIRVGGHAGTNHFPFTGRVHGTQLAPGTYRIRARTKRGGTLLRTTLVIVEGTPPSPDELAAARSRNTCPSRGTIGLSTTRAGTATATGALTSSGTLGSSTEIVRNQNTDETRPGQSGVADATGTHSSASAPLSVKSAATNPLVVAFLGLAVLLLGLAALPRAVVPDPRMTEVVAHHRATLALGGAVALAAAIVGLFLV